jgi:signal transduction histidine kinase
VAELHRTPDPGGVVRGARRLVLATLVFVAAGYLGRATVIDHQHGLSLIWPAIGVGGLWLGSGSRGTRVTDAIALVAATVLVTTTTGATLVTASVLALTNLVQILVFIRLVRRWIPGLWPFSGHEALRRLPDLARLAAAACLSGLAGMAIAVPGGALFMHTGVSPLLAVWWGRNTVALLVVTTAGMLIGRPLVHAGSPSAAWNALTRALHPSRPLRLLESIALPVTATLTASTVFLDQRAQPFAFLLLAMSVWGGLRFPAVTVVVLGITTGVAGIAFTLAGHGPFVGVGSIYVRALSAQAFLVMSVLTGLALAFSRDERDAANRELSIAQRAADERARLLDAVLESMNEGIVVVEAGGRVLVRNSSGRQLLGLREDPGDHHLSPEQVHLFHLDGRPVTREGLPGLRALAGETLIGEDYQVRSDGVTEDRVIEVNAHPMTPVPGEPQRAVINLRDVTVDRQHRDSLASFAGVVAHDLASPLALIDGWAENLETELTEGSVLPAVGLPMVARIHEAAEHMSQVIGDLLSYTMSRDQSLRLGPVDVTALTRDLARLRAAGPAAPVIAVADGLQAWADEGLLRQLFDNLLGNAIKYVAAGTRPAVDVAGSAADGWLEIRITDNGIGIPSEHREQVFDTFHRAHEGYHGTGLGLAICHRIVDRHGGSIRVDDGPNRIGSTFVLTLPASHATVAVGR